ncbi:Conserved_hypothetical protein [Hexamita inflata]|uniref:Uncharacterized protein n=1 Tax=Hexamita inflata TaxID=28002 RepID=A0AA86QCZ0_9EUKA|nr:Conserved hypothetical protein [Hexamita inflata]
MDFPTPTSVLKDLKPLLDLRHQFTNTSDLTQIESLSKEFLRLKSLHQFCAAQNLTKEPYEQMFISMGKQNLQKYLLVQIKNSFKRIFTQFFESMKQFYKQNGIPGGPVVENLPELYRQGRCGYYSYFIFGVFCICNQIGDYRGLIFDQYNFGSTKTMMTSVHSPELKIRPRTPDFKATPVKIQTPPVKLLELTQIVTVEETKNRQLHMQLVQLQEEKAILYNESSKQLGEQRDLIRALEQEIKQKQAEIDKLQVQTMNLNYTQRNTGLNEEFDQKQFNSMQNQLENITNELQSLKFELKQKNNELLQLKSDKINVQAQNSELSASVQKLQAQLQSTHSSVAQTQNIQSNHNHMVSQLSLVLQENTQLIEKYNQILTQFRETEASVKQKDEQLVFYKGKLEQAQTRLEDYGVTIKQHESDLDQQAETIQQLKNQTNQQNNQYQSLYQLQAKSAQMCQELETKLAKSMQEASITGIKASEFHVQNEILQKSVNFQQQRCGELNGEIQSLNIKVDQLNQALKVKSDECELLSSKFKSNLSLDSTVDKLQTQIQSMRIQQDQALFELKSTIQQLEQTNSQLTKENTQMSTELTQAISFKSKCESQYEQIQQLESDIQNLKQKQINIQDLNQIQEKMVQKEKTIFDLKVQLENLKTQNSSLQLKLDEQTESVKNIQNQFEQMNEINNESEVQFENLELKSEIQRLKHTIQSQKTNNTSGDCQQLQEEIEQLKQDKEFIEQFQLKDLKNENTNLKKQIEQLKIKSEQSLKTELSPLDLNFLNNSQTEDVKTQILKIINNDNQFEQNEFDVNILNAIDQEPEEFIQNIHKMNKNEAERLQELKNKIKAVLM